MADGALECPSCGIIVGKWRGGQAPRLSGQARAPVLHSPKISSARPIRVAAAGIAGAALLIGGYWYFNIRPRARAIEDPYYGSGPRSGKTLKQIESRVQDFDLAFKLPGSPIGAATNGKELIVGNRKDPWGAIRLKPAGKDRLSSELVPIIEPGYGQRINLNAITWNGKRYIGLTTGSWFQAQDEVFTVHDASTLRVAEWKRAPKFVGCLAWDGRSYWAATRRNTADSPEPALLYRIDANFNVVSTSEAPGVGCQGLAWDGRHLWFADVFSDSIYVIDVSGEKPRVVHTANTAISYLSGVVSFDGDIWVTDYGKDLLQRLKPPVQTAWAGGASAPERRTVVAAAPSAGKDVASLQRKLRSAERSERLQAERELQDIGAPVDFDRDENRFVDRKSDDTEVIEWSIELRNGVLYGSWRVWFGPDLFKRGEQSGIITLPQFARYTLTVQPPGGSKVEKEFEAAAGDNVMNDVRLADAETSGEYRVDLFLHVQYVDADGKGKILNRNTTGLTVRH